MRQTTRYILLGICGALISACIVCAFLAGKRDRSEILCSKVRIIVTDSTQNRFISPQKIKSDLRKEYGKITGIPIDSLDLEKIEGIIDGKSAVLKSQAYTTKDSTLTIEISQRKPVVRFQKGTTGFYADKEGYIFPLQSSFTSHVQVVDGHIPISFRDGQKGQIKDPAEKEWFLKTVALVNFIEGDKQWKKLIVQIHVNEKGDIILIPREGKEKFIIGKPEDIENKFEKLKKYYTAIIPDAGRDAYKVIDLRYKGRIICK